MAFKLKSVDPSTLKTMLAQAPARGRSSKGSELLEEFLSRGEVAATVSFTSTKERNALAISASNVAKQRGSNVWVRKQGGGTGTDLLLVNLAKVDASTRKAYDNRPRVGRKPSK